MGIWLGIKCWYSRVLRIWLFSQHDRGYLKILYQSIEERNFVSNYQNISGKNSIFDFSCR